MESSSMSDVLGGRAGQTEEVKQAEESKVSELQIDPAELNDIA